MVSPAGRQLGRLVVEGIEIGWIERHDDGRARIVPVRDGFIFLRVACADRAAEVTITLQVGNTECW